jgi:hypothetical protein
LSIILLQHQYVYDFEHCSAAETLLLKLFVTRGGRRETVLAPLEDNLVLVCVILQLYCSCPIHRTCRYRILQGNAWDRSAWGSAPDWGHTFVLMMEVLDNLPHDR